MSRLLVQSTLVFSLIFIGAGSLCHAQQQNVIPYIQSPDAATLGSFGDFDVSAYTGMPNISVPVFSLQEGDIPVNCELRYLSGGVKPSAHPGWVGQNWTLSVGGIVTRKVNGGVDEVANSLASLPGQSALLNQYAYLYNYSLLNNPSYTPWYGNSFIQYYYENLNPTNPNGSGQTAALSNLVNLAPDEFSFTLPTGVTGSFYLNHLGSWVVKTTSPTNLVVTNVATNSVTVDNTAAGQSLTVYRAIYTITITDGNGFIYTFGNSPTAIEFTRGARTQALPYNEDVVADAWYLTTIQSPTGNVVNFTYQRENNLYVQGVSYPSAETISLSNLTGAGGSYTAQQTMATYSAQVINPVYLTSISSRTFNVAFNISPSTQLAYPYKGSAFVSNNSTYFNYSDLEISDQVTTAVTGVVASLSVWYELNSIVVTDYNGATKDQYTFMYNNDPTQRLFLGEFRKKNLTTPTGADMVYHFTYNATPLPAYNSLQQDQWGYYNGILFPSTVTVGSSLMSNFVMNPYDAQAGILTNIIYPTSGTTTFNYEPNDYSYVLQKNGDAINLVSQTGIGGGLRIASIVNTDNAGNSYTTSYIYKKIVNGSPTVSSGVISGYNKIVYNVSIASSTPAPNYTPLATMAFLNYDDYGRCLDYTDGRDVVYSEVQEILPDGSSKIFDYSNSDNPQYMDQMPVNVFSDAFTLSNTAGGVAALVQSSLYSMYSYPLLSHSSMELERGQLLLERVYNAAGVLLQQTQNTYNSDPARFNNYVRSFDNYSLCAGNANTLVIERYFQAIKIYTYFPYLQSTTKTQYDQSGANPVTTTTTYAYDVVYRTRKSESYTASNGQPVSISYNYPNDNIPNLSVSAQAAQSAMAAANISAPLLEKIITRNGVQTGHERTDYGIFTGALGNFMKPVVFNQSVSTLAPEPRILYNSYDPYGHLQEEQKAGDLKHAYLWGYNNAYLVADVTGASYAAASAQVSSAAIANPASDAAMRTTLNALRSGLTSPAALVSTYTYAPLAGMTSKTDATGKTNYFLFDGLNRLSQVLDINSNVVKEFNYNFSFQGITYYNHELDAYYTPACTIYTTGVPYPYIVPAGTYSSNFSQAATDQQAANQAAALGQSTANSQGTCNPNIIGFNTITNSMNIAMTNTTTGLVYHFVVQAGANDVTEGNLPAGTYTVTGCQNATTGTFVFQIGNFLANGSGSTCITFNNVSIVNPGDGAVFINPVGQAQ
jgi:hypothetical protein